ncbi:MAG: type II toxin-antitoxin system RelE/ParE family toxin [Candidatus Heimdallarchaeota archaeon]|nr:type II toxin-antitoxin system RelE/ParE family toxin [Candidatus Heimdallarchaeota archaeon]
MRVFITDKAKKQLQALPKSIRENIQEALISLQIEGMRAGLDIVKLKGYSNHFRLRIGKHRILFEFAKPDNITINWIG